MMRPKNIGIFQYFILNLSGEVKKITIILKNPSHKRGRLNTSVYGNLLIIYATCALCIQS